VHLVARLIAGGYRLLDAQFMTEHLTQFGAVEISRLDYHRRLALALSAEGEFQRAGAGGLGAGGLGVGADDAGALGGAAALQVISQAS
jgi:leucyl/phenylalanyl-tRNA--protein transferase